MIARDRAAFYDAELRLHQQHFRAAIEVGRTDRVLDIGCGAGLTTLEAAAIAQGGSAVGVDVSAEMLEIARRRAADAGLHNISFEQGGTQVQHLPTKPFDLCISRFGTMFFADPLAAFANIGRAMRPGARFVQMVWQGRERNEWSVAIQDALAPTRGSHVDVSPAFSLGDRALTTRILTATGFDSIDFAEVHEPVFYGLDVEAAHEAVVALFLTRDTDVDASPARVETLDRLRDMLNRHLTADGVLFDSRAWIVTARKAA